MTEAIRIEITQKGAKEVKRDISEIGGGADTAKKAIDQLKVALASIGAALALDKLREYADAWTESGNRIRLAARNADEMAAAQQKLFEVAQRTRQSFGTMVQLYGRLSQAAGDLNKSQSEMIKFAEGVGMALQIGGTSATEAAGGLLQLSQMLGSAVVQAQEFNALADSMPRVLQAVADNMPKTAGSIARLKKMVNEGKLESKDFFDAFMKALPKLNEEFAKTNPTISSAFVQLNNAIGKFVGEAGEASGISTTVARAISALAMSFESVAKYAMVLGAGMAVVFAPQIVGMIGMVTSAVRALTVAMLANPYVAAAAAIAMVLTYLYEFRDSIIVISEGAVSLGDYFSAAFEIIGSAASTVWGILKDGLGTALDWITDKASGLATFFGGSFSSIGQMAKTIVNTLIGLFVGWYKAVYTLWTGFPKALADIFASAINGAISIMESGLNKIIGAINKVWTALGRDAIGEVALGRIESAASGSAAELGSAIKEAFVGALNADYIGSVADAANRSLDKLTERAKAIAAQRQADEAKRKAAAGGLDTPAAPRAADTTEFDKKMKEMKEQLRLQQFIGDQKEREVQISGILKDFEEKRVKLSPEQVKAFRDMVTELQKAEKVSKEMDSVWQDLKGPLEDYKVRLQAIATMFEQGKISAGEWAKAMDTARLNYLNTQTDAMSGFERGIIKVKQTIGDVASATESIVTNAFQNMEDSLVDFVTTGKFSIDKLVKGMLADSTRALFKQMMGGLFGTTATTPQQAAQQSGQILAQQVTSSATTFASTVVGAANQVAAAMGKGGAATPAAAAPAADGGAAAAITTALTPTTTALQTAGGNLAASAAAIKAIESGGGRLGGENYNALGPVTRNGDRAYGAYQVMGNNVPAWTEKYAGQRMNPQQFLQDKNAQDAVFNGEFGRLQNKYGPEGASRAWFAGEGGMNRYAASDGISTVAGYNSKFGKLYKQAGGTDQNDGSVEEAKRRGQQLTEAERQTSTQVLQQKQQEQQTLLTQQQESASLELQQAQQTERDKLTTEQQSQTEALQRKQQEEQARLQAGDVSAQQELAQKQQTETQKLQMEQQSAQQQLAAKQQGDMETMTSTQQNAMAKQQESFATQQAAQASQAASPATQELATAVQSAGSAAQGAAPAFQSAGAAAQSAAGSAGAGANGMGQMGAGIQGLLGPLSQAIPGLGQFSGMIMQLLNSLMSSGGGGGGGGLGGLLGGLFGGGGGGGLGMGGIFGGLFATGGSFTVPGQGAPDSKMVGMMLTPGERVDISTPQQQKMGGVAAGTGPGVTVSPQAIRVVNVMDPDAALHAMGSEKGEKLILNVLEKNPNTVSRLINRR